MSNNFKIVRRDEFNTIRTNYINGIPAATLESATHTTSSTTQFVVTSNYGGFLFVGDGVNDDQPAIQACINAALSSAVTHGVTEQSRASVLVPAGYKVRLDSPVELSTAIEFECKSMCYYYNASGAAFIIGTDTTPSASDRAIGYNFSCEGVRAMVNHNTTTPGAPDLTASCGVEIRQAQFSRFYIGFIIAFKKYGLYLNCTNDMNPVYQHVQDNTLEIGQIAYCGYGICAKSASASLGACQVNFINFQNIHSNYRNLQFDESGLFNTNNNIVAGCGLDSAVSVNNCEIWGLYNQFTIGYLYGTFKFESTSLNNVLRVLNPILTVDDSSAKNEWSSTPVATLPNVAYATLINTNYTNGFGVPLMIYGELVMSSTSVTNAASAAIYVGATGASLNLALQEIIQPNTGNNQLKSFSIRVPAGWVWRIETVDPPLSGTAVTINGGIVRIFHAK